MKKTYVINFDDATIFEANSSADFYVKKYDTFQEAKDDLVDYWDNVYNGAKSTLKEVKKIKEKDVKTFD